MGSSPYIAAVLLAASGCSTFLSDSEEDPEDTGGDAESIVLDPDGVEVFDNWLFDALPDAANGADTRLQCDIDHEGAGQAVGLLRFDLAGGPTPAAAQVLSATLRLTVQDHGDTVELGEVLATWDESTSWNSFGPEPGLISAIDFVPVPGGVIFTDGFEEQVIEVDVTDSVIGWLAGERENLGWLFLCTESNGVAFYTREAGDRHWPTLVLEVSR